MVVDIHLAMVVDPQLADDDIMNGARHLPPGIVIVGFVESQMSNSHRYYRQILAPEFAAHRELLPALPAAV